MTILRFFKFWDIIEFVPNIRSEIGTWRFLRTLFRNTDQWYPLTSWLGGFNSKVSGAWGWSNRWGAKTLTNRGVQGVEHPIIELFSEFFQVYECIPLRMLSTKSTISQKLKIANIEKLIGHSFQIIAQFFGPTFLATF